MTIKARTPFERTGSVFERGDEPGKIKGVGVAHCIIMILLDLPELGKTGKSDTWRKNEHHPTCFSKGVNSAQAAFGT